MAPLFKRMFGRGKSVLSMVSKVFEKLVNNRFVDKLKKCGLLPDFYMVSGLINQLQIS